jgi:hypothetical protein
MAGRGARLLRKNEKFGKDPHSNVLAITSMIAFTTSRFTLGIMPYFSLLPALLLGRQMRRGKMPGSLLGTLGTKHQKSAEVERAQEVS